MWFGSKIDLSAWYQEGARVEEKGEKETITSGILHGKDKSL